MALEVQDSGTPKLSLEVDVDPRTVAYCIGKGRSNLREIGNQVLEKTGNSVYIKYTTPKNTNWGHFSILSHDSKAIEIARDLIRESEGKFLENQLDGRIHPTDLDFQVKMPKINDNVSYSNSNSHNNQSNSHNNHHYNGRVNHSTGHNNHSNPRNNHSNSHNNYLNGHTNNSNPRRNNNLRAPDSNNHRTSRHQHSNRPTNNRMVTKGPANKNRQHEPNYQHKREFNGRRREEELPTHFAWEG